MSLLLNQYLALVEQEDIVRDEIQVALIAKLQRVFDQILSRQGLLKRLFSFNSQIKGIYYWGGVGIGKTFLMDLFYDNLPIEKKCRLHFHRFMHDVQTELTKLQGQANPLEIVASQLAEKTEVLCFDEFFVSDIADAMILERLFNQLFQRGVVLVATSNIAPDDLYRHGLHRRRFLPAIALIKSHCEVVAVTSMEDYRFRMLEKAGVYFFPINEENNQKMHEVFAQFARGEVKSNTSIEVENRTIPCKMLADNIIWFDFNVICHTPRSQVDYLVIADRFEAVMVSGVPVIGAFDLADITYLIHLVDVFYDSHIKLIMMAAAYVSDLYPDGEKSFEFKRTISRLEEMQSHDYLYL